jgi:hypothetical protein
MEGEYELNTEVLKLKYLYRINLMSARDAEGNKHLVNKLRRKLRKLEAE